MTTRDFDATPVADLIAALAAHPCLTDSDFEACAALRERIRNHPTDPAVEYGVRRTWWTGRWAVAPACGVETSRHNPFDRQWAEGEVTFYRMLQAHAGLPVDAELITRQWVPAAAAARAA